MVFRQVRKRIGNICKSIPINRHWRISPGKGKLPHCMLAYNLPACQGEFRGRGSWRRFIILPGVDRVPHRDAAPGNVRKREGQGRSRTPAEMRWVRRSVGGSRCREKPRHLGVEQGARPSTDHLQRLCGREGAAVRAGGDGRVVALGHREDPGGHGDVAAAQAVRVARPVEMFVVLQDRPARRCALYQPMKESTARR